MEVRAVIYSPSSYTDELYHHALAVVDAESQARIKRFYHRADSCRTLIGRLLIRALLKERGVAPADVRFAATPEGKPYIVNQTTTPPIAYNVTHDNAVVAMVVAPGTYRPPAFSVGIDVMKLRIPGRESLGSFIETVGDQLSPLEHQLLQPSVPEDERLRRFFWMWTLKEAYTKALGIGMGFDFSRIEFDVVNRTVKVDRHVPEGWRFRMFVLNDGADTYQGVVAEYVGDIPTTIMQEQENEWLKIYDAVSFTQNAIDVLKEDK